MKHLLAALGVFSGLVLPHLAHASPVPSVDGSHSGQWLSHIEIVGHGPEQATYYYTNVVLTGTHVPVVIRKYKGQMRIVSGELSEGVAYALQDGSPAKSGNVSSILRTDPAIQ